MRLVVIFYGVSLFVWFGIEDNSALPVAVYGVIGAILGAVTLWRRWRLSALAGRHALAALIGVGASAGIGAVLTTVALMLFKTGLHSHLFPDYPPAQLLAMLARTPAWSLAGALVGMGLFLLRD